MAAYGAAVSLLNTLWNPELDSIPTCHSRQIFAGVESLKRFLVENRVVKREFETQIRDAIYEAQDIIDSHMWSSHFLSPSEAEISSKSFYDDLGRVKQKITLIAEMTTEEFNHLTLDWKISASVWKDSDEINCTNRYELVGRDEDMNELKDRLMNGSDALQVVPIVGVAGIGKTALARCLLEDPSINNHFDVVGWVKVSVNYNKHDKLLDLLASVRRSSDGIHQELNNPLIEYDYSWSSEMRQKTDDQLVKHIYNFLKHKRYIILLDDIRDVASWNDLKEMFPDYYTRSRILLTTTNVDVAPARPHLLHRLSDWDTLCLLGAMVFGDEVRPAYLAFVARDIASSCRGLPNAVAIVGKLLSCAHPYFDYWEIVSNSINACDNDVDLIEAAVSLTYNHLPQNLKVFLLYTAIFPYNHAITMLKLLMLWVVEGFIERVSSPKKIDVEGWNELFRRGFLALCVNRDSVDISTRIVDEVFHDFLVSKAKEEKFFVVINKETNCAILQADTKCNQQRRLCIQQNIHHFIKDLSECNLNSSVRTIIYSGTERQYRLGVWTEEFKLLEVLDALRIGFYTFPPEILKLVQLKYLAFSYNGHLPPTLCNLQRLQVLIVSNYLDVKCSGIPSYMPEEIWNLKDLILLQVVGRDLPEPPSGSNLQLENLRQLLGVSARSCTRNIFGRILFLETLEVRIESLSEDETLSFFSYLDIVRNLGDFICIVLYPDIGLQVVHSSSIPKFPRNLTSLALSGCGFSWEYMRTIATLRGLTTLILQNYAFQGPTWVVEADEFPNLEYLRLEDMDLENWTFASDAGSSFSTLESLVIRHCYKLQHIPLVFGRSSALQLLEVVDCSTSAMNSALQIKAEMRKRGNHRTLFDIYSSLDD